MTGDGPACGSLGASTFLMVVYSDDSGIHFAEDWYCCHRHVPHPADLLSEDAKVIEVVIADARYTTVTMDGSATVTDGMTFDSGGRAGGVPAEDQVMTWQAERCSCSTPCSRMRH